MTLRVKQILGLTAVLCITLLTFYPATQFNFSNWDDPLHITDNSVVKNFSWNTADKVFHPSAKYMYHPVTILSYGIQYLVWGENSAAFHIANIMLHLFNVVLVYYIGRRLFDRYFIVLIVTTVFALHPMNAEPVVWISSRKDLLCVFFYLLSILSYTSITKKYTIFQWVAVYSVFILALLSKPMALSLPFILLLVDWFQGKKISIRSLIRLLPMIIIIMIFGIVSLKLSLETAGAVAQITSYSFIQRICISSLGLLWYPLHTFYPIGLSTVYGYPELINGVLSWQYYFAPPTIILLSVLLYRYRANRMLIFGALFYCITIALVLQIVPTNAVSFFADRYHYLPMFGVLTAGCGVLIPFISRVIKQNELLTWLSGSILFVLVGFMLLLSVQRVLVWKSNRTIFEDALRSENPPLAAVVNYAASCIEEKKYTQAVEFTTETLKKHPNAQRLYFNRGLAFIGLHQYDNAINDFTLTIAKGMRTAGAYYNLGVSFAQKELNDSAIAAFHLAIKHDSTYTDAFYNIGYLYSRKLQQYELAIQYLTIVISQQPKNVSALLQRGYALRETGKLGKSIHDYVAAVALLDSVKKEDEIKELNIRLSTVLFQLDSLSADIKNSKDIKNILTARIRLKHELGDSVGSLIDQQFIFRN